MAHRALAVLLQACGNGLASVDEKTLYEAALTVIMRLCFVASAQERGLLAEVPPVRALGARLRAAAAVDGEAGLGERHHGWQELLSIFTAVHSGMLFSPQRFPFLQELPVSDRALLHLLRLLQLDGAESGPAPVADVEQLGRVYEALLACTAVRASEPVLGLVGTGDRAPMVALAELERARGEHELLRYLRRRTGRAESALRKALQQAALPADRAAIPARLRAACSADESLFARVWPFAGLLREDAAGDPLVILPGHLYVTQGSDRRLGAHYTPRSLTEPLVEYTLEPLCFVGPAQGLPRSQWRLRPSAELLELKVGDVACGPGALLLQACRYLAARLCEAWDRETASPATIPTADRERAARQLIALRCLYGVDKNPLAAELARLSLWLLTAAAQPPEHFLARAIRTGDSLVGLRSLAELRALGHTQDEDRLRACADWLIAAELPSATISERRALRDRARGEAKALLQGGPLLPSRAAAAALLGDVRPLHWPLEFPAIMQKEERGGFDALLGNPPFLGGLRVSETIADSYNAYLCSRSGDISRKADLVAHFICRMYELLRPQGLCGFISTKTAAEGLTRRGGLLRVLRSGGVIVRAVSPFRWAGKAAVQAIIVHIAKDGWRGDIYLDDRRCAQISDHLRSSSELREEHKLSKNRGLCYEGSVLLSTGFLISPEKAQEWIAQDPANRAVLHPYLGGRELNESPTLSPLRWTIRFGERTEEQARAFAQPFAHVLAHVYPERVSKDAAKYPRMVQQWWKYWHERHVLYQAVAQLPRVLVRSRVCSRHMLGFVPSAWVYGDALTVFALASDGDFAILQSTLHEAWAAHYTSTLRTDLRYVQSSCFATFPRPAVDAGLEAAGKAFYQARARCMLARHEGLTRTYCRLHDPAETAADIQQLRHLQAAMDHAVAAAYGWADLDLGHGFHPTRTGTRYTLCEPAQRAVLSRLLDLNHARYAEELRASQSLRSAGVRARTSTGPREIGASTRSSRG